MSQEQCIQEAYLGCTPIYPRPPTKQCRVVWTGPLLPNGRQPPVLKLYGRKDDRWRCLWRLRHGGRLKAADAVVTVCGNPRCADWRHMQLIPAGTAAPETASPDAAPTPIAIRAR